MHLLAGLNSVNGKPFPAMEMKASNLLGRIYGKINEILLSQIIKETASESSLQNHSD
jgi:hypothetical protein